jgi:threonine/homoserine/homoserine lactone efflux protein
MAIDPAVLPAFLLAVALVELTPGPNMGYLAVLSASQGRLAGLSAVLGVTAGLALYMVAAAFGVTEALLLYPALFALLRWGGVAYILWLAVESWRGSSETSPARARDMGAQRYVWRGFLANVLNPKAAVFYVLLLPGFISTDHGAPMIQALTLGAIHIAVSVVIHTGIVLGSARLGAWAASSPLGADRVWLRRGFALSLAGVAVWLAVSTAR